jgi:RNA polymerase sigma factor (sigma-70 family)
MDTSFWYKKDFSEKRRIYIRISAINIQKITEPTPMDTFSSQLYRQQEMSVWFAELRPDLLRYCRSLCGNSWDTEDIVQDTFIKVMNRFKDQPEQVINKTYLFRTAKNIWIDICRGKQRHAQVPFEENHQEATSYDHPHYTTQELLEALFDRLLPKPFVILLLCDVFGFTAKETANHIGATEGSVQVALSRSRKRLHQLASRGDAVSPVVGIRSNSIESSHLLDAVIDAFRRHNPHQIYKAYSRLFVSGARINAIKAVAGRLYFTFQDPDGNVLMVSG